MHAGVDILMQSGPLPPSDRCSKLERAADLGVRVRALAVRPFQEPPGCFGVHVVGQEPVAGARAVHVILRHRTRRHGARGILQQRECLRASTKCAKIGSEPGFIVLLERRTGL